MYRSQLNAGLSITNREKKVAITLEPKYSPRYVYKIPLTGIPTTAYNIIKYRPNVSVGAMFP